MNSHCAVAELEPFWNDVDPQVVNALDPLQKQEIIAALSRRGSTKHAADVRLSLFGYFLVVIAGQERRTKRRQQAERRRRPVFVVRNLPLIFLIWGSVIYTSFSFILPGIKEILVRVL